MSFTHREFGSLQRQPRLQLCIQQQFSGCSYPSAFYSHDHRRLCTVPIQTQVKFNTMQLPQCLSPATCITSTLCIFLLPIQSKFPGFWWDSTVIALERYICITLTRYEFPHVMWPDDLKMRSSSVIYKVILVFLCRKLICTQRQMAAVSQSSFYLDFSQLIRMLP